MDKRTKTKPPRPPDVMPSEALPVVRHVEPDFHELVPFPRDEDAVLTPLQRHAKGIQYIEDLARRQRAEVAAREARTWDPRYPEGARWDPFSGRQTHVNSAGDPRLGRRS
jgi:hypothetical protein